MTTRAANGRHTTNGMPHGYTSLTPHLVVSPAAKALEFYAMVFGAKVADVTRFGDAIAHATLTFSLGRITLSDALEAYELVAPKLTGPVSASFALYVPNVDEVVELAVKQGATLREPVMTFVSGDRYASLRDPFGVRWSVMTRVEDVSHEESAARVAEWAKTAK